MKAMYRLKDKEKQAALEKWFHNFSEELNESCKNQINDRFDFVKLGICILKDEIELTHEYDPKDWNNYPDVTPPEGVLMRVECGQMRKCIVFEKGKWRYPSGEFLEGQEFMFPVKRFRPWE